MVARAQQAPAERLQRARAQEEQLKAQRDAAQQERVEELRLLQYRSRYIDLRDIERKRLNAITRDSQIYQMHEKAWLRQKTKEEDSFWEEVIKKNQAAMK
ncbi:Protein of unknown function [Gryllus bimaculatus]|nr:Protein of unknown function [Gryllus bimaculatus]